MHHSFRNRQSNQKQNQEYIVIDSPEKKIKLDEQDHEYENELTDFKNSETHKQQIFITYHLFELLINYGYKYRKLPLNYIYVLKQKVDILMNQLNNFQCDQYYQIILDIQDFIESEEPLKLCLAESISNKELQDLEELLNKNLEFQINQQKIIEKIFNNEFFKSTLMNQNETVKICELLLDIADKCFYQQEIIEIIELIIQYEQINDDQKNYIDIYICYISGNHDKAFKLINQDGIDNNDKTPKYLALKALVYQFLIPSESLIYIDQVLELTPKDVNIKIQKGFQLLILKGIYFSYRNEFKKAIQEFDECLKIDNKRAEIYFFKVLEGICHFWLNKKEEYIQSLRMFEYGLILKSNFKFGELLKYYALQKLERKQDEQLQLQKLIQYHEKYNEFMINYAISVAEKLGNQVRCAFSKNKNFIQYKELRNIQKLLLIMSFYKINLLEPQQFESIQNRINSDSSLEKISNNKQSSIQKNVNDKLDSDFQKAFDWVEQFNVKKCNGMPYLNQQIKEQTFICQHCGQINQNHVIYIKRQYIQNIYVL
ncbi:hypothetical protein pb186bvf_002111 [Paramecium bursaria]